MKRLTMVLALIVAAMCVLGMQKQSSDKVAGFMKLKLQHAQGVLEGVVLEDYDLIHSNAKKLALTAQESTWMVLQTEDYIRMSENFQFRASRLADEAKDEDLDAAALSYVQLTLNCVTCHQHVRDVRAGKTGSDK